MKVMRNPTGSPDGFNEAAAYHCGKLVHREGCKRKSDASMRPQHITAENHKLLAPNDVRRPGFNEAAAYHCGKPEIADLIDRPLSALQ